MLQAIKLITELPVISRSWTTFIFLCCGVIVGLLTRFRRRNKISRTGEHLVDKLPGPAALPVIGNCLDMWVDNLKFSKLVGGMGRIYNGMYRVWYFNNPWVMITSADACQQLYSKANLIEKSDEVESMKLVVRNGLYSHPGRTYHQRRKLLNVGYGMALVKKSMGKYNYQSAYTAKTLGKYADSGKEFNMGPLALAAVIRVVWDSLFEKKCEDGDPEITQYINSVMKGSLTFATRIFKPWLRSDALFKLTPGGRLAHADAKFINETAKKYVTERYEQWTTNRLSTYAPIEMNEEGNEDSWNCYVDYLFPNIEKGLMTLDDVCDEFTVFTIGGYETTGNVLATTLLLFGTYPEHQEKVLEELEEVLGKDFDPSNNPITIAHLKQLKHLDLCLKESLRLYPPIPISPRKTTEDVHLDNGSVIPKDVQLLIWNFWSHRDPKYFPSPENFCPDRFLPESPLYRQKGSYMYFPFGVLPRNCIGQQFAVHSLKVSLAYLLKTYKWEAVTSRDNLHLTFQYVSHPENPVLKIQRR